MYAPTQSGKSSVASPGAHTRQNEARRNTIVMVAKQARNNVPFEDSIPELDQFEKVADAALYRPLPDNWFVGVSDIVDSKSKIAAGHYKAVNFAGAATICGVANALGGDLPLFAFAGDGARFAVPPAQAERAANALSRVGIWAKKDLGLELRVGIARVKDVRDAGVDVKVAFWRASDHVRYAMFTGGGLDWIDERLRRGLFALPHAAPDEMPDLTGLSCQWGPVQPKNGKIVSLIVKRAPNASEAEFTEVAARIMAYLEGADGLNPVPVEGPDLRWPRQSLSLQSRALRGGATRRRLQLIANTAIAWLLFKTRVRIGGFDPVRYKREMAGNTDFRKYDDGLLMTIDCSDATIAHLQSVLGQAVDAGVLRYGLHVQDEALVTCVAPVVTSSKHMHFVDGADGGYASAAKALHT